MVWQLIWENPWVPALPQQDSKHDPWAPETLNSTPSSQHALPQLPTEPPFTGKQIVSPGRGLTANKRYQPTESLMILSLAILVQSSFFCYTGWFFKVLGRTSCWQDADPAVAIGAATDIG